MTVGPPTATSLREPVEQRPLAPQPSGDRDRKCHVKSLKSGMVYYCSVTSPILTEQSQPRGPLYIICWLSIKGPIILFLCIRLTSGPIEEATVSFIDHIFPRCPQREEERAEGPRELLFHVLQPPRRMAAGRLSSPSGPFQAIVTAPDSPRRLRRSGRAVSLTGGRVLSGRTSRPPCPSSASAFLAAN